MTGAKVAEAPDVAALEGKYLTFVLGDEEYGVQILKVREIIGIMDVTQVPRTPECVKGVINLRGKVIPVIDLRLKFDLQELDYTKETCIVVVDIRGTLIGLIVDTVSEVLDITAEEIEPTPSFGGRINTDFILGMGKVKGKVEILLDVDEVVSSEDLAQIAELT